MTTYPTWPPTPLWLCCRVWMPSPPSGHLFTRGGLACRPVLGAGARAVCHAKVKGGRRASVTDPSPTPPPAEAEPFDLRLHQQPETRSQPGRRRSQVLIFNQKRSRNMLLSWEVGLGMLNPRGKGDFSGNGVISVSDFCLPPTDKTPSCLFYNEEHGICFFPKPVPG